MSFYRISLFLPFFATMLSAQGLPPLIDRELLFGNPEISGAQISPDGKFLAFIKPYKDTRNTRLNSSHGYISYAVFCLKKKNYHPDGSANVHAVEYRATNDVRDES